MRTFMQIVIDVDLGDKLRQKFNEAALGYDENRFIDEHCERINEIARKEVDSLLTALNGAGYTAKRAPQ